LLTAGVYAVMHTAPDATCIAMPLNHGYYGKIFPIKSKYRSYHILLTILPGTV